MHVIQTYGTELHGNGPVINTYAVTALHLWGEQVKGPTLYILLSCLYLLQEGCIYGLLI